MNRKNNFDFLRLIFAFFVIITHSYPLSGVRECDLFCQMFEGQTSFSYIGVKGFFIISGYLIFQSLMRSDDLIQYYWKRLLRLFPALFVVLVVTVLLAPFVYEGNIASYLKNKDMWTYIPNNLILYKTQYFINGIFDNNPYPKAINGSLWTIPYEFTMYIFISFLFFVRKNKTASKMILFCVLGCLIIGNIFFLDQLGNYWYYLGSRALLDLGGFFVAGSFLAVIEVENTKNRNHLLIVSCIGLLVSLYLNVFHIFKYVFLPLGIILFGLKSTPVISSIGNKVGDASYGIYIYGFIIQQTIQYYFDLDYKKLMLVSIPISFVFGYISWHFIEKKALKLKKIRIKTVLKSIINTFKFYNN